MWHLYYEWTKIGKPTGFYKRLWATELWLNCGGKLMARKLDLKEGVAGPGNLVQGRFKPNFEHFRLA